MTNSTNRLPNRLAKEKSPYLLQHAYNPVDWYPWSNEAFQRAKAEDKPIFLSIGYSTCHWCHVMEWESFEDEKIASILNRYFVSIKVDREERPDIDNIYMTVCQALTGQGGWPLTIVMTPDKTPFFAGTYFPKESRWGRPGLTDILRKVIEKWSQDKESLEATGIKIVEVLKDLGKTDAENIDNNIFLNTYQYLRANFDKNYGGFGTAPKFPTPSNLLFLLNYFKNGGPSNALYMVEKTLGHMARGGIFDQIGFGFHRYSTDEIWKVPHFEKMLYDNALLALVYMEAYGVTQKRKYALVAKKIFTYVYENMLSSEGGFYSAEDADSDGVEGKFYIWDYEEIIEVLGKKQGELFCKIYDITKEGNFEGKNIPNRIYSDLDKIAAEKGLTRVQLEHFMADACKILCSRRKTRTFPHKDDKILTSWNGLMIAAFARGYRMFMDEKFISLAKGAADFILENLINEKGRLLARFREGHGAIPGFLDDYAFFIWGLMELYEASFDEKYLIKALKLNKDMINLFLDNEVGGFYFYGKDAEKQIFRPKDAYDGAMPSGNSVAAYNLVKLFLLTGDEVLGEIVNKLFRVFAKQIKANPSSHTFLISALMIMRKPSKVIALVGDLNTKEFTNFQQRIYSTLLKNTVLMGPIKENIELSVYIPLSNEMKPIDGKPTVYICENFACRPPITDLEELDRYLKT